MPVRVIKPAARSPEYQQLVDTLVTELRQPHESGQPVVTVEHLGNNGKVHVRVIWDRWQDCPDEQRTEIVLEAFKTVHGEEFERSMTVALALTVPEAAAHG